jgi:hypothetical protein
MLTSTSRPALRDVRAFFADITPETDQPIREARDLIAGLRCPYATADKQARVRRLARELIYVSTYGREDHAVAAWRRLSDALTVETDHNGALHTAFLRLYRAILDPRESDRREYRAQERRRAGDLSHLPKLEQAYYRELRAASVMADITRQERVRSKAATTAR